MGIAYEGDAGLSVGVGLQAIASPAVVAPLTLHVAPGPGYAAAPTPLHLQPEPEPGPEVEIGNIMIQLQRFADETADEAERKAQEVIATAETQAAAMIQRATESAVQAQSIIQSAQAEAQSIIQRAHAEAQSITQQVQDQAHAVGADAIAVPAIAPETVHALSVAVEEFAETNRALIAELTQLRQALVPSLLAEPASQATQQLPVVSAEQFPVQPYPQPAALQPVGYYSPAPQSQPTYEQQCPTQAEAQTDAVGSGATSQYDPTGLGAVTSRYPAPADQPYPA